MNKAIEIFSNHIYKLTQTNPQRALKELSFVFTAAGTGRFFENMAKVLELEKQLNAKIYIPENPESCGALGAAIYALNSEIQI